MESSINVVHESGILSRYSFCRRVVKQQGKRDRSEKKQKQQKKRMEKVFFYRIPVGPINCVRNLCFVVVKTFLDLVSHNTELYSTTVIIVGCLFFIYTKRNHFLYRTSFIKQTMNCLPNYVGRTLTLPM